MRTFSAQMFFTILVVGLASCSSPSIATNTNTATGTVAATIVFPTATPVPTATEQLVDSALVEAFRTAFEDPKQLLLALQPGADIYPSYLETHATSDSLTVPGYAGLSLSSESVTAMVQGIDEYSQSVETMMGKRSSKFLVSWNKQQGDQLAFTIFGTEKANGQLVMFWASDTTSAGTPDRPALSFNPFPAEFGVSSPRDTAVIPVALPPGADSSTLRVRWWPSEGDSVLQGVPVIVVTASNLDYVFDVVKSQEEGIGNGWSSGVQHIEEGFPDLGNNTWQILSVEETSSNWRIIILNADGSTVALPPVMSNQVQVRSPKWSPDGKRIALSARFWDQEPPAYKMFNFEDIFVTNADGSQPTRLSHLQATSIDHLVWSPDGTRIAFTASHDTKSPFVYQLYVMNADGTGLTQLAKYPDGVENAWMPIPPARRQCTWQPKGEYWAVIVEPSPSTQLSLFSALLLCGHQPSLSPDGKRIVFRSLKPLDPEYTPEIGLINADGSAPVNLTTDSANTDPAWSPDGAFIAFSSKRSGRWELWIMNADGSGQALLKSAPYFESQWRP